MPAPVTLGYKNQSLASASVSINVASAVAIGTPVVALITDGHYPLLSGVTVTDSKENVYTNIVYQNSVSTASIMIWVSVITTALTTSDTITYTSSSATNTFMLLGAVAFLGYASVDAPYSNSSLTGSASTFSITGATNPQIVGEINIGLMEAKAGNTSAVAGWTVFDAPIPALPGNWVAAYRINADLTPLTFTGPLSPATPSAQGVIALIPKVDPPNVYIIQAFGMNTPLPWRAITPLHRQLGVRSSRFLFGATQAVPLIASPQSVNLRYDASTGVDRIIGFTLSVAGAGAAADFVIQELNTGWFLDYTLPGTKGAYLSGNIETFPDEVNLQFYFSANIGSAVYVSFQNVEVVPHHTL